MIEGYFALVDLRGREKDLDHETASGRKVIFGTFGAYSGHMALAASVGDELTDLLGSVVAVAVKVLIFLVIMGLGYFIAKWLHQWLTHALRRMGFDRAVERGGLSRMLGSYSASDLAARLVVFGFLLFVLQLAFGIFGPNQVSDLIRSVIGWLPRLFIAVVIVVVAAAIAGWVKELAAAALGGLAYGRMVATAVQVLIVTLGLIAALNQIGVASTVTLPLLIAALATIGGILIVGVGGGLIKPMQGRWERVLTRAEAETTVAAERIRANRAATVNHAADQAQGRFDQPAYDPGRTAELKTVDLNSPTTPRRVPSDTETER